ncbi:UNVERIFIED_CONTAM: hypothetical protein NCL1_35261 [Trichonephila clavipes]
MEIFELLLGFIFSGVRGYNYYQNYGYSPYQYSYKYNIPPYDNDNNFPAYQVAYSSSNGPSYAYGVNSTGNYYQNDNGVPMYPNNKQAPPFPQMPPQAAAPGSSKNYPKMPRNASRLMGYVPLSGPAPPSSTKEENGSFSSSEASSIVNMIISPEKEGHVESFINQLHEIYILYLNNYNVNQR